MLDSLFPVFIQHIDELEESSRKWAIVYEGKYEDTNISYRGMGGYYFPVDQIDIEGNFVGRKKNKLFNTYYYGLYLNILEGWYGICIDLRFGQQTYGYTDMKKLLQGVIKLNNNCSDIAKTYLDKLNKIKDKADEINNKTIEVIERNISK